MTDDIRKIVSDSKSLIMSMFGGPQEMDCWLNKGADELARIGVVPSASSLPVPLRNLVLNPKELLDHLFERLHELGMWTYEVNRDGERLLVCDPVSGHILEDGGPEDLEKWRTKYGNNLKEN